jgi:hypothetical protein
MLAVLGFALSVILVMAVIGAFGPWPVGARLVAVPVLLVVLAASGWLGLVAVGGCIGLARDRLGRMGIPYSPTVPREARLGPVGRIARYFRRSSSGPLGLHPGEIVEVRSLEEIRRTLDAHGALEGQLFMPEMAALVGKRFRVLRRVDKLNDWVWHTGLRRVTDTVLLDGVRCNGSGHDGCQAFCHIRWKESWLRRSDGPVDAMPPSSSIAATDAPELFQLARRRDAATGDTRWVCQATELNAGTTSLRWGDPRHYLRDLVTGNIRPGPLFVGAALAAFAWVQRRRGGVVFPTLPLPDRKTTPTQILDLRPGEMVRVRTRNEIVETLNSEARNRGLRFDIELVRHCGHTFRIRSLVDRLIEERTGQLRVLSNPCVILEGVVATGEYAGFCAQAEAAFWREIWLERVTPIGEGENASPLVLPREAQRVPVKN